MRGRPDIDVRMPPVVHAGETFTIAVIANSGSETPINFIELMFRGVKMVTPNNDPNGVFAEEVFFKEVFRVAEKGILAQGTHNYSITVEMPENAPPTYLGVRVSFQYELTAHFSIPWWPDLRETFELLVESTPPSRPKPKPVRESSPRNQPPFIELTLSDTTFAPDDEVIGAFAIGNHNRRSALSAEVSLLGAEVVTFHGVTRTGEQTRIIVPESFRDIGDGKEVPFRFRIPKDVVPSFESDVCRLEWSVVAALDLGREKRVFCKIPVEIQRYKSARERGKQGLQVGTGRWRKIWATVAEKFGFALSASRFSLAGSRGDISIEVSLHDSADSEPSLRMKLSYPSLGLSLQVIPSLVVLLPNELERRLSGHRILQRELAQTKAFFKTELISVLGRFVNVQMDDTQISAHIVTPAFAEASLDAFIENVFSVIEAFNASRSALVPPAGMGDALTFWQRFAERTGARLSVGDMTLIGANVEGGEFDIETILSERLSSGPPEENVLATRVVLHLDSPFEDEFDVLRPETFSAASPGAHSLAAALADSVSEFAILAHSLTIKIAKKVANPADLQPIMSEMSALVRRLRGERSIGPYR